MYWFWGAALFWEWCWFGAKLTVRGAAATEHEVVGVRVLTRPVGSVPLHCAGVAGGGRDAVRCGFWAFG